MLENFRKSLKEDLWKIIDKDDENEEKDVNEFMFFIFYMFLEKNSFSMEKVHEISKCLKKQYYDVLNESKEIALMGEPIKALKNIDEKFIEKIKPIIKKVIKNG